MQIHCVQASIQTQMHHVQALVQVDTQIYCVQFFIVDIDKDTLCTSFTVDIDTDTFCTCFGVDIYTDTLYTSFIVDIDKDTLYKLGIDVYTDTLCKVPASVENSNLIFLLSIVLEKQTFRYGISGYTFQKQFSDLTIFKKMLITLCSSKESTHSPWHDLGTEQSSPLGTPHHMTCPEGLGGYILYFPL